jgi:hypothetical protein
MVQVRDRRCNRTVNHPQLRVAETWRWLLSNEFTFIQLSAFVGLLFNFIFMINARSVEHIKLMLYYFRISRDQSSFCYYFHLALHYLCSLESVFT